MSTTSSISTSCNPLKLDLGGSVDTPPIAALFLIYFDVRAGYTLSWHRSIPDVELEGIVEYKSLPSGLHNVPDDLVYFIHEQFAGLSAFINSPSETSQRNALMLAVGILVPLSYGRLGRSWRHAENLKNLAAILAQDINNTEGLENYWEKYQLQPDILSREGSSAGSSITVKPKSPSGQNGKNVAQGTKHRTVSDRAALVPARQYLSPYHPALSLPQFIDLLGPLVFPLYRAALLRKRILFMVHPPVQNACNFVYCLSILSNIPLAVSDLLSDSSPSQRLRPLFAIGVSDIPYLETVSKKISSTPSGNAVEDQSTRNGWVACTTDGVMATKPGLYDVIVTIPKAPFKDGRDKAWPKIESPKDTEVKATQRDLRRYRGLKSGLAKLVNANEESTIQTLGLVNQQLRPQDTLNSSAYDNFLDDSASAFDHKIIETPSWSAVTYSSLMWWASAGEKYADLNGEEECDNSLFYQPFAMDSGSHAGSQTQLDRASPAFQEMVIIAYFNRLTTSIISTLADIVDDNEAGFEETEDEREAVMADSPVFVSSEDMASMGLDAWSIADRTFVEDITKAYFGRKAEVFGGRLDCCGLRVC
ncbi:MAG: hypothetical protein M1829_001360 [Trizodia sp. TS-e1964]|nr:MAG: hypothetical protein M1829_001360 [Trizodia sp. TS-e1964]